MIEGNNIDDVSNSDPSVDQGDTQTMRGMNWISRVYSWMEKTHTSTTCLIAWVAYVTAAFMLFGLSPVLALVLVLIGIFRVDDSGKRLSRVLEHVEIWKTVEPILMVPLFGFYFLIALRFFEIDLGAVNLRPVSPFAADLVNFIGGSVLGLIVSCGGSRKENKGDSNSSKS